MSVTEYQSWVTLARIEAEESGLDAQQLDARRSLAKMRLERE